MAATAPPAQSAPAAPEVQHPPHTWQVVTRAVRAAFAGTPGRLRLAGIVTVVAGLVFGLFAFVAASTRAGALSNARADAAQLVRIQTIRTSLVSADANLTNAFLVGGLEPPAARAAYQGGIAAAARTLADASGDNAHDAAALKTVNDVVTRYTGLVESARSNNRLGYPLGAAYLRQATDLLRTDALPPLGELGTSVQHRVDNAYSSSASATTWLVIGLVIALIALIAAQVWLAGRVRRVFNLPLVIATAVVLVVGIVLAGVMAWSQSKAKSTRDGAYFATLELATARIDAFDAKSAESLTLIARGQGQAYDASFDNLSANVGAILDDAANRGGTNEQAAQKAFASYEDVHKKIRTFDTAGNWDEAVALATNNAKDGANAAFGSFDNSSGQALTQSSGQLRHDLGSARSPLPAFAWIALIAGIAAAVAAGRGVSTRLREYR
ncbi:MAG TPA: hypothetical protein VGL39_17485 [Jatrophihabitantaceae bacterium]|jgi:hypothetical protein